MSVVQRDDQFYEKPLVPMNPKKSQWDVNIADRMEQLENRMLDLETNVLTILKDILVRTDEEIKKCDEEGENANKTEIKEL